MQASLRRHEWLNHWPSVIDTTSSPSSRGWGGAQGSASEHTAGSSGNHPRCSPQVTTLASTQVWCVNLQKKVHYFTNKMGLSGNRRELQLSTCKAQRSYRRGNQQSGWTGVTLWGRTRKPGGTALSKGLGEKHGSRMMLQGGWTSCRRCNVHLSL